MGFNLEGAAVEWFRWMSRNGLITDCERFKESVMNHFGPSKYEDLKGALLKLLQLSTVEEYQAPVAGTSAVLEANKVVNNGDDSESSSPVTPTSDSESSSEVKVLNWVQQSIDVESTYDNDAHDQVSELEMRVLVDGKQDEAKVVKVVVVVVEQNIDEPDVKGDIGIWLPEGRLKTVDRLLQRGGEHPVATITYTLKAQIRFMVNPENIILGLDLSKLAIILNRMRKIYSKGLTSGDDNNDGDHLETSNTSPPVPPPTQQIPHTNGNGLVSITTDTNGIIKVLPPKTAEEVVAREGERKAWTTSLMALPEDHLAKFHKMADAKEMSLPSSWSQVALIMRTKPGLDTLSFDDLYNNIRVFKHDVKGTTASSSNTQNVAFVSAENTSSTNDVSTAYSVSSPSVSKSQKKGSSSYTDEVIHSFFSNQSSAPQLDYDDLEAKGDQDSKRRDARYNGNKTRDNGRRPAYQDDSKALVTIDEEDIDWSGQDAQNYAMMAYSSSNSGFDNEVKSYSKACEESYARLKKLYDDQIDKLDDASVEITTYTLALKNVEAQLLCHQQNQLAYEQKISKLLNTQMSANDKFGLGYGDYIYGSILSYESEVLHSVFMNKTSDLEDIPVNDRFADGMHAVPLPMTGNYMPFGPDVEIDYSKFTYGLKQTSADESDSKPSEYASCESDSSVETSTSMLELVENASKVVCEHKVWTDAPIIEEYESDGDNDSVSNVQEDQEKPSFAFTDSVKHVKTSRENIKENGTTNHSPKIKKQDRNGNKAHLVDYQEFKGGSVAFEGSNGRITGKGKIKTVMLDFEDVYYVEELKHYNLFSNKVLFTDTDCLVLSPDFKLLDANQILLKIPRQHNMYSFNLKNIDPFRDLACLFAKALIDESNKWHRKLGHVNFKNLNKLVKGNLVRGLPSKIFENDHTCVACQKKKQHKASCKAKTVSSVNQPLQILHMDLFGPTFVRSINHKTYCLVITDGFSRVLVTKPQNKTPYELLNGKQLIISYLRPFGCHVTILNTIDQLGKFNGKSDSGFLVGYSLNNKAFRVYNLETKRVEENLHVNFLENKPNVVGEGHAWIFDLDYLTNSMNYEPVLVENQANKSAGPKEANNSAGAQANDDQGANSEEINLNEEHFVLPIWSAYSTTVKISGDKIEKNTGFKTCEKPVSQVEQVFLEELDKLKSQEKEANDAAESLRKEATHDIQNASASSTNLINTASTSLSTADDPSMPNLEDIYASPSEGFFTDSSYDDKCVVTDFNNLETTTRSKVNKNSEARALISQALEDESWVDAMQEELLQFQIQKIWILVDLPFRKKAIGTKWVYRNKKDERGVVVRNKAQLVAQGHRQEEWIDYDEVFAPAARIEAIRIFLAFASYMGFIVYQIDVNSAFMYGTIDEEVNVSQPPGFIDHKFPNKVYKVVKALYALHEAPSAWYATLSTFLAKSIYRRGAIDKTLFIKKDKKDVMLVQVYVDDIIFGSSKKSWCDELMNNRFQMSSMGKLTFFLGLQLKQKEDDIFISQDKYVAEILKKFDFLIVKTASTPIEIQKPLVKDEEAADVDVYLYRFQVTPKTPHLHVMKRIFRYLKGQSKLGLWYPKVSSFDLEAYSDSDYAGANLDRKSTTG
nr:putative ribonuclease H-like domain-containing protein [Tanacetum cinerariifolium]